MFTPPPPPPPLFNNPFHKLPTTPIHAQSSYSNAGGMLRIHMARTSAMSSDHTGYTGTPVASTLRHHHQQQQQQPNQHQLASMIGLNAAERVTPDGQQPHHQQLASSLLHQRQQPAWFAPLPFLPPVMPLFGGPTPHQVCRSISQPSTTIQYRQWASEAPPGHVVTTRQDAHNAAVPQQHLTSAALVPPPAKVILIPEHHTDPSTVSAAALEASHPVHHQAHLASSVPSSSMAVSYPQTARGGGDIPEAITQGGSRAKAASTTPLVDLGLGFHHSSSDVMELQLAVHALELENAALRRRAKERSKALVEAQGKVQSLQEALVEAELLNTGPRTSPSTSMLPPDYGVVSSDLRSIVGLLTKAGQLLQRPKECGSGEYSSRRRQDKECALFRQQDGTSTIRCSGQLPVYGCVYPQDAGEGGNNDESVRTLEEEVEGLRRKLAEAERMITSSHAREFDLVV
ncbi:hypothetical protein FOZ63_015078 [Perkinsus olseni]|uniref:Uncharacterized protein n=1 Tax=Perkinsus olseni TaxID=32597 RepID=A0A7J6UPB5_PEROL|nr:hypothetical protein FOZ63_015078 [Perkinsus olseni]